MVFSDRLKILRKEKKLTQEELGKRINVTKVSISGYENGNRTPDTETLQKLADFFEVSVDYLLGRSNTPTYKDEPDKINVSFRDGGGDITEEEAEYLEQQLKQFREWRKRFQQEDK